MQPPIHLCPMPVLRVHLTNHWRQQRGASISWFTPLARVLASPGSAANVVGFGWLRYLDGNVTRVVALKVLGERYFLSKVPFMGVDKCKNEAKIELKRLKCPDERHFARKVAFVDGRMSQKCHSSTKFLRMSDNTPVCCLACPLLPVETSSILPAKLARRSNPTTLAA